LIDELKKCVLYSSLGSKLKLINIFLSQCLTSLIKTESFCLIVAIATLRYA